MAATSSSFTRSLNRKENTTSTKRQLKFQKQEIKKKIQIKIIKPKKLWENNKVGHNNNL
jgi:hypothetical protein